MNTLHLILLTCLVASSLMLYAGMAKRVLELKRRPFRCPSCGRLTPGCRCRA